TRRRANPVHHYATLDVAHTNCLLLPSHAAGPALTAVCQSNVPLCRTHPHTVPVWHCRRITILVASFGMDAANSCGRLSHVTALPFGFAGCPMSPAIVEAQQLGKRYRIYSSPWHRFLGALARRMQQPPHEVWAVKGVNLSVPSGRCIGIIGMNGAGKSTL